MQQQQTDWQTTLATNRIGEPSSWTAVAVRFGAGEAEYGVLYYSPAGCYFVPDAATMENQQGIQSLLWGPGLVPMLGEESGGHAIVEMSGGQLSMAADHAQALVRIAAEGSAAPAAAPGLPMQPTPQQAPMEQQPGYPAATAPQQYAPQQPAQVAPGQPMPVGYPAAAMAPVTQDPNLPAEPSKGGGPSRILIYGLIAIAVIVVIGGGYVVFLA
jgi:hypothetical protein